MKDRLLEEMMEEFKADVSENPLSLSAMRWYAFGWLLYISIKLQSFLDKMRRKNRT